MFSKLKVSFMHLFIILFCLFEIIGCSGGGGGSNPVGSLTTDNSIPGEVSTSIRLILPSLDLKSQSLLADGIQASNCFVKLIVFNPQSSPNILILNKTFNLINTATNEIEFHNVTGVLAYAQLDFDNLFVMESHNLHGAIDIQLYKQNVINYAPKGSRSKTDLVGSLLARLAEDSSKANFGALPKISLIEEVVAKLASDSPTIYEDAWVEFEKILGEKGLTLVNDNLKPMQQIEIVANGFTPSRTSYEGFIEETSVVFSNKNGKLTCPVPSLASGWHTVSLTVDGWSSLNRLYISAYEGQQNPDTFIEDTLKVFDDELAGLEASSDLAELQAENQKLREDFAKLTPEEKQIAAQFMAANQEFFSGFSLSSASIRRSAGRFSFNGMSVRADVIEEGVVMFGPNSYLGPDCGTGNRSFVKLRAYTENGITKVDVLKSVGISKAEVKASQFVKDWIKKIIESRKKAASKNIVEELWGKATGVLRKKIYAPAKDTVIFQKTKMAGSGVRGNVRYALRAENSTSEPILFQANTYWLEGGIQFLAKYRTLKATDFLNGNENLIRFKELNTSLKQLETAINQNSAGSSNFSLNLPNLNTLTSSITTEDYLIHPSIITSTKESIAKSISNPKVRLDYFLAYTPHQENPSNLYFIFLCDELDDQDFTFDIEYQAPGFAKETVTVKARVTTKFTEYWDQEETQKRREGSHDSQGNIFGKWSQWRDNGTLYSDGESFRNSSGEIMPIINTEYYDDGAKRIVNKDFTATDSYKSFVYYPDGKLQSERNYKDGLFDGLMTEYYENGNIHTTTNFENGKKNGLCTNYYQNGNVWHKHTFKDDFLTGPVTWFFENGNISHKGQFIDGKTTGTWHWYSEDGTESGTHTY